MRKGSVVLLLVVAFLLGLTLPGVASVEYDVAEAVIGDAGAFPVAKSFIEEKLGKPDFTEEVAGFPGPLEVYVVNGSEEISHIYLIYGTGEGADKTYAMGVVMKGIDLSTMVGMIEGMSEGTKRVVLRGENFAILDLLGQDLPQTLWALFEERTFQGEKRLTSTLIPPENLVSYFASAYPDFGEPLQNAIKERVKKE
ncbi:MAG: hypothetical protein ACP5Q4_07305 [Candidatus Caldatribacteriaceae bacterium]